MFQVYILNYHQYFTTYIYEVLQFIFHLNHLLIFQIVFYSLNHILIMSNVLFSLLIKVMFLKAHQNYKILSLAIIHFNWVFVQQFKNEHVHLLEYLNILNKNYSILIVVFFITNVPMNAWLTSLLIQQSLNTFPKIFILIYSFSQLNGIFAIHFAGGK